VQQRPDELPLSYAQERLWLLEQIEAAGSAYNLSAAVRLRGSLDVEALSRSFAAIVERHEGLRTRFAVVDGSPVQMIGEAGLFRLELEDLSGFAEEEREGNALRWTSAYVRRPFDLERGGLLRAAVLRLSEEEHVAIVVMHHIVSDGWSIGVLIREVEALYGAYSRGQASPLAALPVQYADYAVWQRSWLHGEVLEKQLSYWKGRLAGAPAALELPTDRSRPSVQSFRGASVSLGLSKDLIDALQAVARSEGATLFMVLVAAFQLLLSRWSGQSDVVVGTPVAGRTHRETEGLIGFFVNMLALRTDLSGDPSFRELLGRVKETALGAYAHQDLPFEKLVEELQPVRDLSRRPIFQVMINSFLEENPRSLSLPGLQISALGSEEVSARFELMLRLMETARGVICGFEYATDLFDEATIEQLAGQFRNLLGGLVQRPEAAVSELEVLGPAERLQLLAWSSKAADYLSGSDVIARIGEHRSGDRGDPVQGLQGYVLDRWLGLAAVGVIGELYIGGTELWDDGDGAALTASRFIPDPFGSGQRLYRTSELARWRADGVLEIVDEARHAAASAETADDAAAVAYEAPRTPLEELLAGIWVETLGVERVGVHDNFFALGGHSLLAMRVVTRVRDVLGVGLTMRALFDTPNVGELADQIQKMQQTITGNIPKMPTQMHEWEEATF
jgi:acyl carrier protein